MKTSEPTRPAPKFRKDYSEPDYWIENVRLDFDLAPRATLVRARLEVRRNGSHDRPLVLDGEELETLSLAVDGRTLAPDEYALEPESLTIGGLPDRFELVSEVRIAPEANTALSGLYRSSGNYCTQCEAEGFRRITWFLDRPDVMARFTTTLTADRAECPVLLSNGNRVREEDLGEGRHRVTWEDPFKKPSYLFALVAGDLACHSGEFRTASGRNVRLEIWVEPRDIDACEHALASLQRAMRWDERAFGREYDLDVYMIVAVSDFNMGAMENKGLNIFNSKYVLARPETATDDDYEAVEGVIAHEYFHNWTGNRVTCRDWFQLTLKEGLTVFRDQQFSADMSSAAVRRIHEVARLRSSQFPEDAGPMAHPIRPESYIEMDNFYTATVYEKGSEVIRMYHTLLGPDGFRRGMDLYFQRHDGEAVTCDDFRAAMADANGRDLAQFERWYTQAGTPRLVVQEEWDAKRGHYTLDVQQVPPAIQSGGAPQALHVPIRIGLIGADGADEPLVLAGESPAEAATERVLELTELRQKFTFTGLDARPVPSILRGFSAPVLLDMVRERGSLSFQLRHDSDAFNRWDAGQTLFTDELLRLARSAQAGETLALEPELVEAMRAVLVDDRLDGSMRAFMMSLPSEGILAQRMSVIDPDALFTARRFVRRELVRGLEHELRALYAGTRPTGPYAARKQDIDRRRAGNAALAYLIALGGPEAAALAMGQFERADNMTESEAALAFLADLDAPEREAALSAFYERWRHDPLVLDKWFTIQATSRLPGAPERIAALMRHPDFSLRNPNRVRALVGSFSRSNHTGFHCVTGRGYALLGDTVLELDALNPQVASRLVGGFNDWKRYDVARQELMRAELERISARPGLSKNVYEIVTRALALA